MDLGLLCPIIVTITVAIAPLVRVAHSEQS